MIKDKGLNLIFALKPERQLRNLEIGGNLIALKNFKTVKDVKYSEAIHLRRLILSSYFIILRLKQYWQHRDKVTDKEINTFIKGA